MSTGYTIKEIAKELNLSRNTVAKVLNNKPGVSEKTVQMVQRFLDANSEEKPADPTPTDIPPEIADNESKGNIIFTYFYETTEYLAKLMSGMEIVLKSQGYNLILNIIRGDRRTDIPLPATIRSGNVVGIISFNIFIQKYWQDVLDIGIPAVFIDTFYEGYLFSGRAEIVLGENTGSTYTLVQRLINNGKTRFGFIGDYDWCYSHYQRYLTTKSTLEANRLSLDERFCYYPKAEDIHSDRFEEILHTALVNMGTLPDVFICTCDIIAVVLLKILNKLGVSIPKRVSIIGYDNLSESARQTPPLTTVDNHPDQIGAYAAQRLIERINEPDSPYHTTFIESDIIERGTTDC